MTEGQTLASGKYWRVWSAVAVVFVCGLLVGIVGTSAYDDYKQQQRWERGLAGLKPRVMTQLTRELHLSREQQQAIDAIVSEAEADLLRLRMAQQPRVEETATKTIEMLKTKLTAEQKTKLEELYRQLQRRWDSDREYVRGLH
jgi:predicted negative regulator of RcsB-dependent stress response